jgi:DNA-directed RNA polymerase specialized sigma24 family protein
VHDSYLKLASGADMAEHADRDPALSRLMEQRFFGALTAQEIATMLGLSERTVQREWRKARALVVTL